jgi:MFS family permease
MQIVTQIVASRAPMASFAAMGVLWGCLAASMPDLKAMLGAGDALFGGLLFFSSAAAVAAMLLAPRLGDRLGGAALPVLTLAMGLAFLLPGHLPVAVLFAGAMVLIGASSGSLDVLMNARLSAIEAARRLPLMNLNHGVYSLCYAGAALATGLAREAGAAPAQVLGVAALAVLALAAATIERGARIEGLGPPAGAVPRLGPVPFWAGLVILIAFLAENATEAWSALHIERTLGGSPAQGALGPALLGLTMGIGRLMGQAVVARLPERRLMRGALVVAVTGAALVAVAPTPAVAYAGFIVLGLGVSVVGPTAFALVGRLANPETRARAIARAAVLGYLGFFFGPPLLGVVAEIAGLRAAFATVAVVLLAGSALLARLARHDPLPG